MTQIFVGNLSYSVCESKIRDAFERFGRVSSVRLMIDAATNRSRGFAFVQMPSLDDADEAIKRMSGSSLNGRQLTVNEAQDSGRSTAERSAGRSARDAAMAFFASLQEE